MKVKMKPLADKVLIRRIEEPEKKAGGIVIPDVAKEAPCRGTVRAIGDGKLMDNGTRVPPCVAEGDEVLFVKYQGTVIEVDEREYVVLREEDLLAKLSTGPNVPPPPAPKPRKVQSHL